MDEEEKKLSLSGTLSRRLSKRFSKKVSEETLASSPGSSPSSPALGKKLSLSGASFPSASNTSAPAGMPHAAEVEQKFLVVCRKARMNPLGKSLEDKWKAVQEFSAAQKASAEEVAKTIRRAVKKPRFVGQLGFFGYVCGQEPEWICEFVRHGGVKQLLKAVAKLADGTEEYSVFADVVHCLKEVVGTEEGIEAFAQQERHLPCLFLALDLCDEKIQVELLQTLSAVSLKTTDGCSAIIRSLLEKKLLPQQQQTFGRAASRQRASTADSAHQSMEARNLSWTGMDRLTNLLLGGGSSDDLMLASVMALHAVLLRPPLELRVRLVEALKQGDLTAKLDLLTRDTKDPELRALVSVLREKNPEFRSRDLIALTTQLKDSLRFQRESLAAFGNMLEHMQKLDRSNGRVWTLLEGFVKSVCLAPPHAAEEDVGSWFSSMLLASACDGDNTARSSQLEAVKGQLDLAMRRIEACPKCSAQGDKVVNPVVLMRQLRKNGAADEESSDESSEFVDVDLDGVRATKTVAVARAVRLRDSSIREGDPGGIARRKSPGIHLLPEEGISFAAKVESPKAESNRDKRKSILIESLKDDTLAANEAQAIADLLKLGMK